jgi:hypothetical protein
MPHSFGPNELWELIDSIRITIGMIIASTVTVGAVVGLIIASLEARRDNKIQTRPEPPSIALEDGIKRLLAKQFGTRIKPGSP